jgi:hypothetical protein
VLQFGKRLPDDSSTALELIQQLLAPGRGVRTRPTSDLSSGTGWQDQRKDDRQQNKVTTCPHDFQPSILSPIRI